MNPSDDELSDIPEGLRPLRLRRRNAIIPFDETYRQFYNRVIVPISTATLDSSSTDREFQTE